jgi:plasmid maintenance system antidote protein VapI
MAEESLDEIAPWTVETYPGRNRAFAELLGIKPATGRHYTSGRVKLPPKHALRLADYLDEKQRRIADLVLRLREYAAAEGPQIKRKRMEKLADAHEAQRLAYVRKVRARQEEAEAATSTSHSMPE